MLIIDLPGRGCLRLENLVLDLNGTIALDGVLADGVAELVSGLSERMHVTLITADTHGGAAEIAYVIGAAVHVIEQGAEGEQKAAFVRGLDAHTVAAVGAGANDAEMLALAEVGVCVIGPEGAAGAAVAAADVITTSSADALGLFLHPSRLVATLRR